MSASLSKWLVKPMLIERLLTYIDLSPIKVAAKKTAWFDKQVSIAPSRY